MSAVDDALNRADGKTPVFYLAGEVEWDDIDQVVEDRRILAAEVKRLRAQVEKRKDNAVLDEPSWVQRLASDEAAYRRRNR